MHQGGVLHGDLKPENIMVKRRTRAKGLVGDLGSSCVLKDGQDKVPCR
jgi:serine/threonine protein kinase